MSLDESEVAYINTIKENASAGPVGVVVGLVAVLLGCIISTQDGCERRVMEDRINARIDKIDTSTTKITVWHKMILTPLQYEQLIAEDKKQEGK